MSSLELCSAEEIPSFGIHFSSKSQINVEANELPEFKIPVRIRIHFLAGTISEQEAFAILSETFLNSHSERLQSHLARAGLEDIQLSEGSLILSFEATKAQSREIRYSALEILSFFLGHEPTLNEIRSAQVFHRGWGERRLILAKEKIFSAADIEVAVKAKANPQWAQGVQSFLGEIFPKKLPPCYQAVIKN